MNTSITDMLKEIAEELDCGFRAFFHKTTGQLLSVPNQLELYDIDMDSWSEELEELEQNFMDYNEIEKWTSREAFEMMTDFAEQLHSHKQIQSKLLDALSRNKPFSRFKFVIDDSGDVRQQWFDFKSRWQQNYVLRQIIEITEANEEEGFS